jgi:hypothetical protein
MLRELDPVPACVQNSRYDVLAYNRTYAHLLCDFDALPPENRNCLVQAFTNPEWHGPLLDRDEARRQMVANFRAFMADHIAEPAWKSLLKRLQRESPEFRELWARHEVARSPSNRVKRIRNRHVGLLYLEGARLWLAPQHGTRLIAYVPADDETRERLTALYEVAGGGGGLPAAGGQ